MSYDVLIIGAGAAGLAAAAHLARAGRSARVLEARDRVGGRIWSHQESGLPVPVELGAEFIHGEAEATFELLKKAGSAAIDATRTRWSLRDGKLVQPGDLFREVRDALRRTDVLKKKDMPFATLLDRHLHDELSSEARAFARMLVEGFDAADSTRASARAIAEEWLGGGAVDSPQFRPLGGHAVMLDALANALRGTEVNVQLRTVVRSVQWKRGKVDVTGTHLERPFHASAPRAIVTLPLGVLQQPARESGAVRFAPALKEKRSALKRLAPGPVLKLSLRFRSAFWEELDNKRYRNAAFFHAPDAVFPTFWTTLPVRTPLLVAWAAGPKAVWLATATRAELVEHALASLVVLFGKRAGIADTLEGAWLHDWQRDPFARGAYSYVVVNGDDARENLAKPLKDTLFFAGEATDTEGEAGTVAGALQSGARAAREVLRPSGKTA